MKCILDGGNARIFAKAIQSLAKFGADLFMEWDRHGMQLRSLNATRSAVGTFRFKGMFFDNFEYCVANESFCTIPMKAVLSVFRNMKHVVQLEMELLVNESKFHVKLRCRLETLKTALLSITGEENITIDHPTDDPPNIITGSHKIFNEISSNFNTIEEEITIEATDIALVTRNYIDGSRVNDKFMRSHFKLAATEFDSYKIERKSAVTFCLKEFRAFLHFAETLNESLTLKFSEAGSPIYLSINKNEELMCLLIMTTLSDDDVSFYDELSSKVMDTSVNTSSRNTLPKRKRKSFASSTATDAFHVRRCTTEDTTVSNESGLFQFNEAPNKHNNNDGEPDCEMLEVEEANADAAAAVCGSNVSNRLPTTVSTATSSGIPEQIRAQRPEAAESGTLVIFRETEENTEYEEDAAADSIQQAPPRPPGASMRTIFSRCFDSTYIPREPSPNSQSYVPDSDED